MTPHVNNFAQCGCGRSLTKPYCDGSHSLTEDEYITRQEELPDEDIDWGDD
jgi:CDGSH-type Zn-finger protein